MEVIGLWRYPVKSLHGEAIEVAELVRDGLAGDRQWGLLDLRTGRILTARRRPELLTAAARLDAGSPVITLPDGEELNGAGTKTDQRLSEWLGGPVSLVSSRDSAAGRAEYFADATDDSSQAIEWTMPDGRYVDAAPLLVLTTASLRTAAAHLPGGTWDPRRFRPNVLLEVEGDGWVEDGWTGHRMQFGSAAVRPAQPCVRCTMVTRAQPGLTADVEIFRTLARHHRGLFGVWTDVLEAGIVRVGDKAVHLA